MVNKFRVPLMAQPYGKEEILEAMESLISGDVTMGKKVAEFERLFAAYIGKKFAVMVNSGSSANLLALTALVTQGKLKPGDEVITPSVTWATTVFPIVNCGAVPVLIDVDLDTFNISATEIEKAITSKTKVIMLVHLLGNPCNMKEIMKLAAKHNLIVIEDACESHGAEIGGVKTGCFGDMSVFSFFYSHHITTIEGGMILTDDYNLYQLLKSLRVFGWIRELDNNEKYSDKYPELDPKFLFINIGYCFRPTELQGAFGIHQIKKLDNFIQIRRDNAEYWYDRLSKFKKDITIHQERNNTKHAWFGYPIIVNKEADFSRKYLTDYLNAAGIETRPVMTGNIALQPVMKQFKHRIVGTLPNATFISKNAFFFGNHQNITHDDREYVANCIASFLGI